MTIEELRPLPGEHACVIGATGCGKSHLVNKMLQGYQGNLAILDPKREFTLDGLAVHSSFESIKFFRPNRFIFRPQEKYLFEYKQYDEVYKYCYRRGNFTVYTDDLIAVLQRNRWPIGLQLCYMLGRSKHITTISSFQRPKFVPLFVMSEFSRAYVFHLEMDTDEFRAAELIRNFNGESLPEYGFWYRYRRTMKEGRILKVGE